MKHGQIILKLNKAHWDNMVLYAIQVIMALSIVYGLGVLLFSIDETPEMERRRREVEAVVEEREADRERLNAMSSADIDFDTHPELNPLRGAAPKKIKRYRIRVLDTITLTPAFR